MQPSIMMSALALSVSAIAPAAADPGLTVLQTLTQQTGGSPEFPPIIGQNGLLYGTTYSSNNDGAIYSIDTNGKNFAVLYAFPGGPAGAAPLGGLTQDASGLLYGTTLYGGNSAQGTVFAFDPSTQTVTVLHSFDVSDGSTPYAGLVADATGNLYGTTSSGGANNLGTVYKLAAGTHAFTKLADLDASAGGTPYSPLLLGGDGWLYGTTTGVGTQGDGTIFRVATAGGKPELLHNFTGPDGIGPFAGRTAGKPGLFYGTTDFGGPNNAGVVFAFSLKGRKLTVLHPFSTTDGACPQGGIAVDRAGRLLGTTFGGGTNGSGVIYSYTPKSSTFQVLQELAYGVAGNPNAGLTYAGGKIFYGGTLSGGTGQFPAGAIIKFSE